MCLGDFREKFSTRLHTCSPASHPVLEGVTSPQRGEAAYKGRFFENQVI